MSEPIYFPFTFISDPCAEALGTLFEKVDIYQPLSLKIPASMQHWIDKGVLNVRVPVVHEDEKLNAVMEDYLGWAQLHQGKEMKILKTRMDKIPFYDDISVHNIKSQIKNPEKNKPGKNKKDEDAADPLFSARLFLVTAQKYDEQFWGTRDDILSFTKLEESLYNELKGEKELENNLSPIKRNIPEDSGIHMTKERILNWFCLAGNDPEFSNLMITTSRAVFDQILDENKFAVSILEPMNFTIPKKPDSEWFGWWNSVKEVLSGKSSSDEHGIQKSWKGDCEDENSLGKFRLACLEMDISDAAEHYKSKINVVDSADSGLRLILVEFI